MMQGIGEERKIDRQREKKITITISYAYKSWLKRVSIKSLI